MGSVCCVADRDRAVVARPNNENSHRNIRHSPSWSFRWDNRVQVVGDESSLNWNSNGAPRFNERVIKSRPASEIAHASEEGSPFDNSLSPAIQKSPVSELSTGVIMLPSSESPTAGNSNEVKQSFGSPEVSFPSPVKLSPSMHSISSFSTSPLSSQGHPSLTPLRWPRHSPRHRLLRQVSDNTMMITSFKSPTLSISEEASSLIQQPGWSYYDSTRVSVGGSSDGWSIPTSFPDIMTTSRRERWSFDSETLGLRSSLDRSSGYRFDSQTCGVCARLVGDKSSWGTQKIIASNELAVVAVLICGHVYHAECLENMTLEINKYDPACPVCMFGEKQAYKMCDMALKAEIVLSKKRCRSKNGDIDFSGDLEFVRFDHETGGGQDGRSQKLTENSSTKSPFLKKHFSFVGSKSGKSLGRHSSWKRGLFWAKSSKK